MEISDKDKSYEVEIDFNYITNDFDNLVDEQQDENTDSFGDDFILE